MDAGMLGQLDGSLPCSIDGGSQQRRIVTVGARRDHREGYAVGVHHGGAFDASLPPVHRAFARLLAPARSLRDTSIDAHIGHLQADDPIVGFQSDPLQGVHHASLDPLVAPPTQRSGRAPLVGDPPIGATEYENLDELLEDYVIGNAGTMTAERMIHSSFGQQDAELFPDGFDDVRLECGHGGSPSNREASATPRMIEDPCPPYMRSCSLLVQALSLRFNREEFCDGHKAHRKTPR